MHTTIVRRLAATWLLLGATTAACSTPLAEARSPVRMALDPFVKAGYACAGPKSDTSSFGQWQCDLVAPDGTSYDVVLDANDSGVKQVTATVDQSRAAAAERDVAARFFHQVSEIVPGGSGSETFRWVDSNLTSGGQQRVGSILVTLDGLRSVTRLVLFVPD